ncbi:MAG: 16S rRNA (guanine(966)-N(2))-methyltransferase RsmD [Candidatus Rokubacteria bacterium 13_1_20CM_4_68_9]|nr:MAG: 16S rRNA (guanine(966)-N(2))-methyltransferase RsmD [Candidatus Rokubacteria bacterium 13_1_20CM_4_68_9]
MRILAGELKGRRLTTPRGAVTRPTADQVRIALMDTLAPRLPGARVLDLFAGAGGVGLEALSRGAVHTTFVERDRHAVAALRDNIASLGVQDRARVLGEDVARALDRLVREGATFDVVFLDPPYESSLGDTALDRVGAGSLSEREDLEWPSAPSIPECSTPCTTATSTSSSAASGSSTS